MLFVSDRRFRIWDYNVGHDQMLLRSPESPDAPGNVDIAFVGVEYVGIPSMLAGIELSEAADDEVAMTENIPGRTEFSTNYILSSGGQKFVVVACGFKVLQNTLELFESSLEYFAASDPNRDLGQVLASSSQGSASVVGP